MHAKSDMPALCQWLDFLFRLVEHGRYPALVKQILTRHRKLSWKRILEEQRFTMMPEASTTHLP